MIRYVKFANINNIITRIRNAIKSFIIILLIVKKIETSIGASTVSLEFPFECTTVSTWRPQHMYP